jgi:hypothetical protein
MKGNFLKMAAAALSTAALLVPAAGAQSSSEAKYDSKKTGIKKSPLSLEDFELLKKSVLFTEEDVKYLQMSGSVLEGQIEQILDVWYGFVGGNPHLVHYFSGKDGKPDGEYLAKVRARFGEWIRDTYRAQYDQDWLNYQYEIGLRHHRTKKNKTDGVKSVPIVNYRYLPALVYPITFTLKPFLAKGGHSPEEVEKMHQAWLKSVILQVILWSQPYVKAEDF